jgi:hypothetical protein
MKSIPAALRLNTNSEPCSNFSADNPRSHCPICNKQTLEPSNSTEFQSNKTTNNTEHHPLAVQRESLTNKTESKDFAEGNCSLNLENIKSERDCKGVNERHDESSMTSASNISMVNSKTDLHYEECHKDKSCDLIWNGIKNIQDYLEERRENFEEFLVPENILKKKVLLMGKWARVFCCERSLMHVYS